MADWSSLSAALDRVETSVGYSWAELDALVGGLPPSAEKHRAWWSGNRPHVNAWRAAGFSLANLLLGQSVSFVRNRPSDQLQLVPSQATISLDTAIPDADSFAARVDLLLITCVKEKLSTPAPARDLYVSTLFKKERAYAERTQLPWFILSAEHGLVAPDEWLAPYERYLPDTPPSFRAAWGAWVIERLRLLAGPLTGKVVEIHAGAAYIDAVKSHLVAKGATVLEPLHGLTMGQRLAWYSGGRDASSAAPNSDLTVAGQEVARCRDLLLDHSKAVSPSDFLATGGAGLRVPGLYSWWADRGGAAELTRGLGLSLPSGLVYAGLAGATRWPSGKRSTNTLWGRISGMHLGNRHEYSTFRRILGSILASTNPQSTIDESALTSWMNAHLKILAVPYEDADTLGQLEEDVLQAIDPPLNLKSMSSSPIRLRIKQLRRPHSRGSASYQA